MSAYVYLLAHKSLPRFKIGKALHLLSRIRQLGMGRFDFDRSQALRVVDDAQACNLERLLHRAFAQARIAVEDLVQEKGESTDGNTEWFEAGCKDRLDQFLSHNQDLLGFEPVGAAELRQLLDVPRPVPKTAPASARARITDVQRQAQRAQDDYTDAEAVTALVSELHAALSHLAVHYPGLTFTPSPAADGYGYLSGTSTAQKASSLLDCLGALQGMGFRGRQGTFAPVPSYSTQQCSDGVAFRLTVIWPGAASRFHAFAHTAQLLLTSRALPIAGWPAGAVHFEQEGERLAA